MRMMLEELGPPLEQFRDRHPHIRMRSSTATTRRPSVSSTPTTPTWP
ncbi:MAG: hypothetical protein WKF75_18905 [Singulisphaera sp.]